MRKRERRRRNRQERGRERNCGGRETEILSPLFFFFSIPLFSISVNSLDNIYIYIFDKSMSLKYPKMLLIYKIQEYLLKHRIYQFNHFKS